MRKRSVACLCLLLIAVTLLSACDDLGGKPASTPVPQMTSEPSPPPQEPEEDDPNAENDDPYALESDSDEYDDYDEYDEYDDESGETDGQTRTGAGRAAGGSATPDPKPSPSPAVRLTPDPAEEPISIDPLDKPTPVPLNLSYIKYESSPMGISFDRPAGWREDNPADSNVQFTEPESAARNGYRAMLTIRVVQKGAKQDSTNARVLLEEVMDEMAQNLMWTDFRHNQPDTGSLGSASGYYTYYFATFNDVTLKGRIIVVARGSALYMVRITSAEEFYLLYEDIYRRVRTSWSFTSN